MMFSGKVVAVTGAAGGIGQALCRHFAAGGAANPPNQNTQRPPPKH